MNRGSKNKYHARKVTADGITFDSEKEYNRWCELKMLEKAGRITNLRRQVRFEVIPKQRKSDGTYEKPTFYVADFVYDVFADGCDVIVEKDRVEDVKGCKKGSAYREFVMKRKLMLQKYKIEIREI